MACGVNVTLSIPFNTLAYEKNIEFLLCEAPIESSYTVVVHVLLLLALKSLELERRSLCHAIFGKTAFFVDFESTFGYGVVVM